MSSASKPPIKSANPAPGGDEVLKLGLPVMRWSDGYHHFLTMGWPYFLVTAIVLYTLVNMIFAGLYLLQPGGILGARPDSFADAFFFSVQTLGTIGYGVMSPGTIYTHILVTIEVLVGLFGLAIVTGMMFARFARPTSRVMFSRCVVVENFHGIPTLMFRCANARGNQILEAGIRLTLVRTELSPEGHQIRRLHDLRLLRERQPMFSLGWTVMHPLESDSPLFGATDNSCHLQDVLLLVNLMGLDDVSAQTVHARHRYYPVDIRWQHRFVDIAKEGADGRRYMDYSNFHETTPLMTANPNEKAVKPDS